MRTETLAKLACAYSGVVWGLFWIPLRQLQAAGIDGLWASLVFYTVPFLIVLPIVAWRWRHVVAAGAWLQLLSAISALGLVLYSIAVLYTDVVRAILLFYTTPFWSALLARIVLGEPITPVRWLSMAIGVLGLLVILRGEQGLPWPDRLGDWLALASAFLWAVTAVMLRADRGTAPIELFSHNFLWSGLVGFAITALAADRAMAPPLGAYLAQLPWLVPTIVVVVMSGVYAAMWGAPKLNPGVVGLLFMTEITTGAITAALWAGEPFGAREVIGVLLITAAGVLESVWELAVKSRGFNKARRAR